MAFYESPMIQLNNGRWIGGRHPCYIIAELGQNHQGDLATAKALIDEAKSARVDCVKLQKSHLESRFTQERLNQWYRSRDAFGFNYRQHKEKLELSEEAYRELKEYASLRNLDFTASGMDKPSIDFLNTLNVPFIKIGSADTTNLPLLKHACQYDTPLFISTGMTSQADIVRLYPVLSYLNSRLVLMQCSSSYPTLAPDVNLNVLKTYKELFPQAVIGFSSHEIGLHASIAAVALGAKVLERHITLDHTLKGSDHNFALDPGELAELVFQVRRIEFAMGSDEKKVLPIEEFCYNKLGKTIVANRILYRGTIIEEDMIDVKCAVEKGIDPIDFYNIIGYELRRDLRPEETIKPEDLIEATKATIFDAIKQWQPYIYC